MALKDFLLTLIIVFLLSNYYTEGQNSTNTNGTTPSIEYQVKPSGTGSSIRHLFLLLFGCLLTTFFIIGMIITYNRVVTRQSSTNTNFRTNFHNFLQSIGLNNLTNRTGLNFFSISNNNNHSSTHHHHHHRQGESSRTHLNENQDEALLFDDPYADGGISGGIHGSSANPYKSLTLSVT